MTVHQSLMLWHDELLRSHNSAPIMMLWLLGAWPHLAVAVLVAEANAELVAEPRQACALPALARASAWLKASALPDACA